MIHASKPALDKQKPNIVLGHNKNNNDACYDNKSVFDKKIELAVEGLNPSFESLLRERTAKENALFIAEYNIASVRETNSSLSTRKNNILTLVGLSKFLSQKDFREMTREDILQYLNNHRKLDVSDVTTT